MKRIDAWLMDWLDGKHQGTRPGSWRADFWARLCLWQCDRYWRKYGEGPMVTNG